MALAPVRYLSCCTLNAGADAAFPPWRKIRC